MRRLAFKKKARKTLYILNYLSLRWLGIYLDLLRSLIILSLHLSQFINLQNTSQSELLIGQISLQLSLFSETSEKTSSFI